MLALLLFLTGVVFCYFAVYSLAVDFFLVAGDSLATPMLSIDKYVSFLFGFLVPFGVAFQLPVVLYLTTRVGLTTPDMLRSKRKYVILAIFVLAAILTPRMWCRRWRWACRCAGCMKSAYWSAAARRQGAGIWG